MCLFCCCVENFVFNFHKIFDVMFFVDCALYLYRGLCFLLVFLWRAQNESGSLRGVPVQLVLVVLGCAFLYAMPWVSVYCHAVGVLRWGGALCALLFDLLVPVFKFKCDTRRAGLETASGSDGEGRGGEPTCFHVHVSLILNINEKMMQHTHTRF